MMYGQATPSGTAHNIYTYTCTCLAVARLGLKMSSRILLTSLEFDLKRICHRWMTRNSRQFGAVEQPKRLYSRSEEEETTRMMPFEEYRKLRRRVKTRSRLAGVPMAFVGTTLSSAVNIHFNPQMMEFQNPEVELNPIL